MSEWASGLTRPVAWLSLEGTESDPVRFLSAVVAALQTISSALGEAALVALRSPQAPPTQAALTSLLHDVSALTAPVVLVLDDYHLIDAGAVDVVFSSLLEHLPPTLHLAVATREDPQVPLARWRAQDQLTEVRAADLRFGPAETAEFLGGVMGLKLSASDLAALNDRTEGWIAGLQLAALSMRGRDDLTAFIRSFTGDHRYIVDYLVEEVLRRQPESVRRFLLQTAVLERLTGPLCDAVTGQDGGAARLHLLERGNFFVVPLDDGRHWYRYHHLFADVLSAQLLAEQPGLVPQLHRRASDWYDRAGLTAEAVRHALAAGAFGLAAGLIERALPALRRARQELEVLGWLRSLPASLLRTRPVLCVHYAGGLLLAGDLGGAAARLQDAEHWLERSADLDGTPDTTTSEMVVVDAEEFQGLAASIAVFRAGLALAGGDLAGTVAQARRVLDLVPETDEVRRGSAAGFLGLASWTLGDLDAAHRWYSECQTRLTRAGYLSDATGCAIALGDLRTVQGRLAEARSTYERGLQLAAVPDAPALRGAADMHVGLSGLCLERGDLQAARLHLVKSQALGDLNGLPQNRSRWQVAMAGVLEAEGDLNGALERLDEAAHLYNGDFFPDVRPVAALRVRLWIRQERWEEALGWAREAGLSAHDDMRYLREFEHVTLARLLARSPDRGRDSADVLLFLERLLFAAQAGGRTGSVTEILLLQALAEHDRGGSAAALLALGRALTLAEPAGYVRLFVSEGPTVAALLRQAARAGLRPAYAHRLLKAFGVSAGPSPVSSGLDGPLSEREHEVLRWLRSDLSGPDLAGRIGVSLNTLRTHTKNIYSKLGVRTRRAAVQRAEELGWS